MKTKQMQSGFFDLENRYEDISAKRDPLERLNAAINWERFRAVLESIDAKERKSAAGRKPLDRVLLFKMLILQQIYNLSDDALEYQVCDRLSFMRFLDLHLSADVPDAKTVWAFRESLKAHELTDALFEQFHSILSKHGVKLKSGQIIDASFVPVPVQRNSKEDNLSIKEGAAPKDWEQTPNKLAQKDTDARWAKKGDTKHYGYKNHINIDRKSKIITAHTTTSANEHDSKSLMEILRTAKEGGKKIWADSAYRSQEIEQALQERKLSSHIHEKGSRAGPLDDIQKHHNRKKSKVRARVEHVFGAMKNEMGGKLVRSIGLARAKVNLTLKNLAYNLKRTEVLIRMNFFAFKRLG